MCARRPNVGAGEEGPLKHKALFGSQRSVWVSSWCAAESDRKHNAWVPTTGTSSPHSPGAGHGCIPDLSVCLSPPYPTPPQKGQNAAYVKTLI